MKMENKTIIKRTVIISAIIIFLDQITKFIVIKLYSENSFEIIKNIFYIDLTQNTGIAFSLNSGNLKNILISGLILFFIIRFLFTQKKYLNIMTLTTLDLVIAGGISNLIDRIFRGGVIDFISISEFPIFNIADVFVVIRMVIICFLYH